MTSFRDFRSNFLCKIVGNVTQGGKLVTGVVKINHDVPEAGKSYAVKASRQSLIGLSCCLGCVS